MVKTSHLTYFIFLLIFCIGGGDGRWKRRDRENLERDIKLYKKITERVEHEIQEYYAEYEDHGLFHYNVNRNFYEINKDIRKNIANLERAKDREQKPSLTKIMQNIPKSNYSVTSNEISKSNSHVKAKGNNSKWPKFEDILLAIGKKYDWKNDRWIKVKEKFKIKEKYYGELDNSNMIHEKHRFSYRTIKLNRGKNKRNVVIAVTAIR